MSHPTTHFADLNDGRGADIDVGVAAIVNYLNDLGVQTTSSCQGDPGELGIQYDPGRRGHVAFIIPGDVGYEKLAEIMFMHLRPMFAHLHDSVRLELVLCEEANHFKGWFRFRNEHIGEITKRLGCYVEMLHK